MLPLSPDCFDYRRRSGGMAWTSADTKSTMTHVHHLDWDNYYPDRLSTYLQNLTKMTQIVK